MDVDNTHGGQPIGATGQDMNYDILKQVLKQSRVSESTIVQMAAQIAQRMDEFGQVVVSAIRSSIIQGSNPFTATVGQVADPSSLAPPPTSMPEPPLFRARQVGPPRIFRDPVPRPVHRPAVTSDFHVSLHSLLYHRPFVDRVSSNAKSSLKSY